MGLSIYPVMVVDMMTDMSQIRSALCALGVDPMKKWVRIDEAADGYILVALENEIFEFNISNRHSFEQNLLDRITFER